MLIKLLKDNLKRTNDCVILAAPLIIISTLLSAYCSFALKYANDVPKMFVALFTLFIMSSAFSASWFYMVKKTISLSGKVFVYDKDRYKALWKLFLSLPEGLGKFFLPFMSFNIMYFTLVSALSIVIYNFSSNYIFKGTYPDMMEDPNFLIVASIVWAFHYFIIFWVPEIVYARQNPLTALVNSFKKLKDSFPVMFYAFIIFLILTFVAKIIEAFLVKYSPYNYFFALVIDYYLLIYIVVFVFDYYERFFVKED